MPNPPDLGQCQCCNDEPGIDVAAVPGMPLSIVWGVRCLEADVVPYGLLVGNTAMAGGIEGSAPWWRELVQRTLTYFNKTEAEFAAAVAAEVEHYRNLDPQREDPLNDNPPGSSD